MKAKPSQAAVIETARQGVGVVDESVAAMKRRIETADLRQRRERLLRRRDAGKIMRLMQRRERDQRP